MKAAAELMWYLHIAPDALPKIDEKDVPGLLRHAKCLRAQERLENIADMRAAMARTDADVEKARMLVVGLAKKASSGDKDRLARILVQVI